jgi:hypothetical protein
MTPIKGPIKTRLTSIHDKRFVDGFGFELKEFP